ncbi:MAG: T9SS type A sorting domain-containing protein [Tenuifilaceae bacterium]|jgi:hypothetical protein|nr:T9SS type A sorting domain-containing protein [Tenuifilaceae bacterium]
MKRKILLRTALLATTLMLFGSVGWGQETVIYSTGFENSEGFTATTTYNNATVLYSGPAGEQWGRYYGTPSTTGPITDAQSMQMRWYSSTPTNLGYVFTDFNLTNVTKVEFKALNTSSNNVTVQYSTDNGGTWVGDQTFTLSTSASIYTYNISATGEYPSVKIKFVFSLPGTPVDKSRVTIDDIIIYGIPSGDPELVSTPIVLSSFGYGFGEGPSTSQSFALTGNNLNGTDVTVTAPANFEVSLDDATFSSSVTLTAFDGTETTVYTRLVAGLAINDYAGDITIAGGGDADGATVAVSGKVVEAFGIPYTNEFITQEDIDIAEIQGLTIDNAQNEAAGYLRIFPNGYVETPTIDFTQYDFMEVSFSSTTYGGAQGQTITVKISINDGIDYTDLASYAITSSYVAYDYIIDLTDTYNSSTGKLKFEMTAGTASTRFKSLSIEEVTSSTWNGTGNWSDANWTPFAPLSYYDVIVNSGTLAVDASHEVATVTVNPGANLTIETGNTLTADKVTLKAGTDKTLASLLNFGTLTASTVEYQRYMPTTVFEYVSSPVQSQTAAVFGTLGTSSAEGNGLFWFSESGNSWENITEGTTPIGPMSGYAYIPNANTTVTFSGTAFYSGSMAKALSASSTGFNLVGNPYPAAINWDFDGDWSRENVTPNIWINYADAPTEANFATYNSVTDLGTNWIGNIGDEEGVIPPTQAFWVEASAATTLTVFPTAQQHSPNPVAKKSTSENPLIRLQAQRSGYSDEMVIFFHSEATEGMDRFDTRKKLGSGAYPQLYAPVADAIAAVNTLPQSLLSERVVVPITLKSDMAGSITISLTELKNLEEDMNITLTDKATGTQTDLRTAAYTVEVEAGSTLTNRFEVTVERKNTTSAPAIDKSTVNIYASARNIYVGMAQQGSRVEVYNAIGVQMLSHTLNGSAVESIPTNLAKGVYIVVVNGSEGRTVKRIFIN